MSEGFMFKIVDELLKESRLTDEMASKLGDELKERVGWRGSGNLQSIQIRLFILEKEFF